jgi:acyl transferase domain-containing protein/NAD(P)-dependent dehydrogenase (short-subunit alcohol dehydrogenase family)
LPNVLAGRICNRFDFGGANFTVDAACASSLAAVYLACRSLADGSCDLAITGGCDTMQSVFAYLCFTTAGALSKRGRSRAFDAGADGITISEGLAAVALKRLEDAERDGDRIYAVIRGIAGGSDGRSKGLTAPRVEGQIRTLERAYGQAGFSPATVGLFEAHGTGTALGDATECQALGSLLARAEAPPRSVAVGSVKSMIGHTKASAGVVGLIKAALALYERVLPPTLHVETPNPAAGLNQGPLYVNSEIRPWIRGEHPRRAGVSSFGFGGSNFHAVLEEADDFSPATTRTAARRWPAELFALAAGSQADLAVRVRELNSVVRQILEVGADVNLADLAFTLHCGNPALTGSHRAALVSSSLEELRDQLTALADRLTSSAVATGSLPAGVHWEQKPLGTDTPLCFLFSGQAAQFPNMLRDLAVEFAEVADCFALADVVLHGKYDRRLSELIFPPPPFTDTERDAAVQALKATDVTQPALGVCSLGLLRLLKAFGIRPGLLGGHSYGELVALCTAGSFSEEVLLRLSWARGNSMFARGQGEKGSDRGAMIAVRAGRELVAQMVGDCPDVWIANHNAPQQVVLSGTTSGIERIAKALTAAGISHVPLTVSCAFHSPLVASAQATFTQTLRETEFAAPAVPTYSNVTASVYPANPEEIRRLLAEQMVREVRFLDEIESLYAAGSRVFVEIGPAQVLGKLLGQTLGDRPYAAVGLQTREGHGVTALLGGLATLVAHGVTINLERLYQARSVQHLDLSSVSSLVAPLPSPHSWVVDGGTARPSRNPKEMPPTRVSTLQSHEPPALPLVEPSPSRSTPPVPTPSGLPAGVSKTPPRDGNSARPSRNPKEMPPTLASTIRSHEQPAVPLVEHSPARSTTTVPTPSGLPVAGVESSPSLSPGHVSSQAPGGLTEAYREFQETMRQFLLTQQRVAEVFLQAEPAPSPVLLPSVAPSRPVAPPPSPPPVVHATEVKPVTSKAANGNGHQAPAKKPTPAVAEAPVQPQAPSPRPAPSPAPAAPAVENLEGMLLGVVAERTGYPVEMVSLDADLEADLGIDSIKRVEIIGAFRRAAVFGQDAPPSWFMEEMAAVRSLRPILAGVSRLRGKTAAPTVSASEPVTAKTAPVPSQAPAAPVVEDLEGMLLGVVAERTGYPVEMLSLDADLEADLGIDSIKRVEIIGAFRRLAVPGQEAPPSWFMEEMAAVRSLRPILAGVTRLRGKAAEPTPARVQSPEGDRNKAPGESSSPGDRGPGVPRCLPVAVPAPLNGDAVPSLVGGVVVLTDDGQGVAAGLADSITRLGGLPATLSVKDLSSRASVETALGRIRQTRGPIRAVLHLLPLRPAPEFPGTEELLLAAQVEEEVKGLLYLLQGLSPELTAAAGAPLFVGVATRGGGDFGQRGAAEAVHPWRGGIAGLLKVAAKEWPAAHFRAVDFEELPNPAVLLQEMGASGAVEIGYRAGQRLCLELVRQELPDEAPASLAQGLTAQSVVLVTGGGLGITAEVTRAVARQIPATFILLGRTQAPAETEDSATAGLTDVTDLRRHFLRQLQREGRSASPREVEACAQEVVKTRALRQTLAAIRATGARAEYCACDVRDRVSLEKVVRDVTRRFGGIDAVIHGAGLIEDRRIGDKTSESFDRVFWTKVSPLITLAKLLDHKRLKMLMLFSSVAAFLGNEGQGDYAIANETLNRMARRLTNLWSCKVVALNWGPWGGGGMVSPEVARQFEARGIGLIPPAAGCRAAVDEFRHPRGDEVRLIIGQGEWVEKAQARSASEGNHPCPFELPPLLNGAEVRRSEGVVEARVFLDPQEHPYLRDHQIDNTPVLPLAAALELLAEVASIAQPKLQVTRISNLRMFAGVVLREGRRQIALRAEPIQTGPSFGEWRVRLTDPKQPARPLYEALVRLDTEVAVAPPAPSLARIATPSPVTAAQAYDQWLFHGPLFHVIESIQGLDSQGLDAMIRPACWQRCLGPSARRNWLINPIVVDAAPQAAILWARANYGTVALPNRIGAYHRYGDLNTNLLRMVWRASPGCNANDVRATVWFLEGDRVVGHLEGLEATASTELNRLGGRRNG